MRFKHFSTCQFEPNFIMLTSEQLELLEFKCLAQGFRVATAKCIKCNLTLNHIKYENGKQEK